MVDALVQALVAHFDSVFAGPNGDYPAILEALAGITAEQAAWKPAPECNSIWQIMEHLTASKEWQMEMLEKGEAKVAAWTQPVGDENAWQDALGRLKEAHARQKGRLGQLSAQDLFKVPEPAWNMTLLELLLSSAAHEAHHGGQIDYLKGLQAAI